MTKFLERAFAWCGGGAFVAALAVGAWVYTFKLGIERAPMGWSPVLMNALLLTAFAFHHSLFAHDPLKRAMARIVPERLLRSVYVWIASALFVIVCLTWRPVGGRIYEVRGWAWWVFTAVQAAGILLIARAAGAIDPLELAGIRPSQRPDEELEQGGVYGFVRHPIYLGWVLAVFGAAHMTGDRLTFAVLTTAYLVIAVPWEERSLERQFGDAYRRYKQQVKWRIVPYLY